MRSNSRVLLAQSNMLKNDSKQLRKMQPYPPLATIQAAATLRETGFDVALYDPTFDENLDSFSDILKKFKPDVFIVYEDYFNFITKMCLGHMRQTAQQMCRTARSFGASTIAASPDTTDHPLPYLRDSADYVLIGEADHTVLELCQSLAEGSDPLKAGIPGVAGISPEGEIIKNKKRALEKDLSKFPLPAWDLIEIEPYRQAWQKRHGYFSLNMVSSRGCPHSCNWCAKPIWGQHFVQRPPELVAEELTWLRKNFKPDHVWFADDNFGCSESWLKGFNAALKTNGKITPYAVQSRADHLNPAVISGLKESGCSEVWLGAESGSQKILNAMDKSLDLEEIKKAVSNLKAAGIKVCLFLQFGYPGEVWEDIHASVQLIRVTFPDNIGVSVTYPLPGTPLYYKVKKSMGEKTHWDDSDDLDMLFQGAYTTPFYKKLHQVLHAELKLRHLAAGGKINNKEEGELWSEVMSGWMELGMMEASHRRTIPKSAEEA